MVCGVQHTLAQFIYHNDFFALAKPRFSWLFISNVCGGEVVNKGVVILGMSARARVV